MKRATEECGVIYEYIAISIHALVKRATSLLPIEQEQALISIHALVKRATKWQRKATEEKEFQSTPS